MNGSTVQDVKRGFIKCAEIVSENKEKLTEIDSMNGDGDLGVSMEKGTAALRACAEGYEGEAIGPMFTKAGAMFNKAAPSTMGTLIGMSLMTVGNTWKDKTEITETDWVAMPGIMASTIARFGKSKPGDKTVLDALCPFAETLVREYAETADFTLAYDKALDAARAGLESTRGMVAAVGRARWLGERAAEACDGGAYLCVCILENIRG